LPEFGGEALVALAGVAEHREGLDGLAPQLVRDADHRGFDHLVMGHQDAFDIERPDPVARNDDHVFVDDGCSREVVTPNRWSTCQVNVGENPALLTITTKVAAAEFAARRITVNAVGPGQHGHRAVRAADGAATRGSGIRGVEVWRVCTDVAAAGRPGESGPGRRSMTSIRAASGGRRGRCRGWWRRGPRSAGGRGGGS
jgi:hypothetical protein